MSNKKETTETLYDWDTAPHWAQWAAMDGDGMGIWYEEKPKKDDLFRMFTRAFGEGMFEIIKDESLSQSLKNTNWKKSLEQRPQTN